MKLQSSVYWNNAEAKTSTSIIQLKHVSLFESCFVPEQEWTKKFASKFSPNPNSNAEKSELTLNR